PGRARGVAGNAGEMRRDRIRDLRAVIVPDYGAEAKAVLVEEQQAVTRAVEPGKELRVGGRTIVVVHGERRCTRRRQSGRAVARRRCLGPRRGRGGPAAPLLDAGVSAGAGSAAARTRSMAARRPASPGAASAANSRWRSARGRSPER